MDRRDSDLDKELRFHLELLVEQNLAAGMSPAEARRQARLAFGGPAQIGEECREVRSFHWLSILYSDLRYGLRTLWASKAFTATAILSLALGIGANASIFTLLHAALWKPLQVPRPVELYHVMRREGTEERGGYSWVVYQQLQETFAPYGTMLARGGAAPEKFSAEGSDEQRVMGESVSGTYFRTLEISPAAGRLFEPADDNSPSPEAVIVLSHALWMRRFHGDPAVVGKVVQYQERPFRIAGVAQAGFTGVDAGTVTDVWAPTTVVNHNLILNGPHSTWLQFLVRLKSGVAPETAQAALDVRFRRHLAEEVIPEIPLHFQESLRKHNLALRPAASGLAQDGRQYQRELVALMAVVGLVLLISCANVANLLLARQVARREEIAVRVALGAGRMRLASQLLMESFILAGAGTLLGVLLGSWSCEFLVRLVPSRFPLAFDLTPDGTVLGFAAALAVTTAVLCGAGPIWRAFRLGAADLNAGSSRITSANTMGRLLVAGQLALSLLLVGGAGLFLKTLYNLTSSDLGFRPAQIVEVRLQYPRSVSGDRRSVIIRELQDRLRQRGELTPTYAWPDIYSPGGWSGGLGALDGHPPPAGDNEIQNFSVGPDFFGTLGMHLLAGRDVARTDDRGTPLVAVVNETFTRRYFPSQSPVGHVVTMASDNPKSYRVIGVVADVKHMGVRESVWPVIYFSSLQSNGSDGSVLIRSNVGIRAVTDAVRADLTALAPEARIDEVRTMNSIIERMLGKEVLVAALSAAFGLLAVLLAAVGLYGVMAYNLSRRTREIGVRIAVGAQPGDIHRLVTGESLRLVAAGLAIGLPALLACGRLIDTLLYGMTARDPWVLGGASVLLAAIALVAGWVPASRAARTDPTVALR